jgi:hypothetical protein
MVALRRPYRARGRGAPGVGLVGGDSVPGRAGTPPADPAPPATRACVPDRTRPPYRRPGRSQPATPWQRRLTDPRPCPQACAGALGLPRRGSGDRAVQGDSATHAQRPQTCAGAALQWRGGRFVGVGGRMDVPTAVPPSARLVCHGVAVGTGQCIGALEMHALRRQRVIGAPRSSGAADQPPVCGGGADHPAARTIPGAPGRPRHDGRHILCSALIVLCVPAALDARVVMHFPDP